MLTGPGVNFKGIVSQNIKKYEYKRYSTYHLLTSHSTFSVSMSPN